MIPNQNKRTKMQGSLQILIGMILLSQKSITFVSANATLAQLVEQRIRNAQVASSSLASGSVLTKEKEIEILYFDLFFYVKKSVLFYIALNE